MIDHEEEIVLSALGTKAIASMNKIVDGVRAALQPYQYQINITEKNWEINRFKNSTKDEEGRERVTKTAKCKDIKIKHSINIELED